MPNFERNLRQTCTYWAPSTTDAYGKPSFVSPVQKMCRWEDVQELFINKLGQEVTSKSKVFLAEDIALDGYLFLGTSVAASPNGVLGAFEIQGIKRTPDLRALKTMYVAML